MSVASRISDSLRKIWSSKPPTVTLVAVSKFQPTESIRAAYDAGQRIFGENYVTELVAKAQDPSLQPLKDIEWHFIGHLQSNKAKILVRDVPNLACVQSVDSTKVADKLDAAAAAFRKTPLTVFIQVNSSGEAAKSGVEPGQEVALAQHILRKCRNLALGGVMTIGNADYSCGPANFATLRECRESVAAVLAKEEAGGTAITPPTPMAAGGGHAPSDEPPTAPQPRLHLSMGMSADWPAAVDAGSTLVRVGMAIFGSRPVLKADGLPDLSATPAQYVEQATARIEEAAHNADEGTESDRSLHK